MAHYCATPDTFEDVASKARAGDRITLKLADKPYGRVELQGLRGPITIDAEEGVCFDGGRRRQDFDLEANTEAKRVQQELDRYPGLYLIAMRAQLVLRNCGNVTLKGFGFRGCWPTCVAIDDCQDITFCDINFQEATYAIYAQGKGTRGLTFERCSYVQDISEHEMWREINWELIHGGQPVCCTDRRALDGEFLRTYGIAGDVTIRHCTIRHAFNGIHMYHNDEHGKNPNINRNVRIHDNRFEFIRDNAIEPEWGANQWWVFHNHIRNCHKVFSVECKRSASMLFVGNTYWFDEKPTPHLDYNGGAIWKLPKKVKPADGANYALHNSFYLRSKYIKKRRWRDWRHFNNAIQYCADGCHPEGVCDPSQSFFGNIHADDESLRFTKEWTDLDIRFHGDMAHHRQFPHDLLKAGYALEQASGASPGFRDPAKGDFRLRHEAAARGAALAFEKIALPDGSTWPTVPCPDVGAWQGESRITMPDIAYSDIETTS